MRAFGEALCGLRQCEAVSQATYSALARVGLRHKLTSHSVKCIAAQTMYANSTSRPLKCITAQNTNGQGRRVQTA
eukprot:14047-Rhodomonas_salina.1